jgi:hypothetical protein
MRFESAQAPLVRGSRGPTSMLGRGLVFVLCSRLHLLAVRSRAQCVRGHSMPWRAGHAYGRRGGHCGTAPPWQFVGCPLETASRVPLHHQDLRRKWAPFMLNCGAVGGGYIASVQWVQDGYKVNQSPGYKVNQNSSVNGYSAAAPGRGGALICGR